MLSPIKRRLKKYVSSVYDPQLSLQVGKYTIKAPLSHPLRDILPKYPDYNFNLGRILGYLEETEKEVSLIDIGANIGDTIAFVRNHSDAPILCIDGSEEYFPLLLSNSALFSGVQTCKAIVGAETGPNNIKVSAKKNTGSVTTGSSSIPVRTLENILEEFSQFKNARVLKSDTDGYDTIILRSCEGYLKARNPVLFFEYDPFYIRNSKDNPSEFLQYLVSCNYRYFIVYTNVGDLLIGLDIQKDTSLLDQLTQYFTGREGQLFADICAYSEKDSAQFELALRREQDHFASARRFDS
jgi:FkbM family methyltransferase